MKEVLTFMSNILTLDFYDRLLYKYYGRVYYGYDIGNGCDCTITCYYWNGKYYIDEVKYD